VFGELLKDEFAFFFRILLRGTFLNSLKRANDNNPSIDDTIKRKRSRKKP
jgi:hypothetical protein